MKAGFDTLVQAGFNRRLPISNASTELKFIVDLTYRGGLNDIVTL